MVGRGAAGASLRPAPVSPTTSRTRAPTVPSSALALLVLVASGRPRHMWGAAPHENPYGCADSTLGRRGLKVRGSSPQTDGSLLTASRSTATYSPWLSTLPVDRTVSLRARLSSAGTGGCRRSPSLTACLTKVTSASRASSSGGAEIQSNSSSTTWGVAWVVVLDDARRKKIASRRISSVLS